MCLKLPPTLSHRLWMLKPSRDLQIWSCPHMVILLSARLFNAYQKVSERLEYSLCCVAVGRPTGMAGQPGAAPAGPLVMSTENISIGQLIDGITHPDHYLKDGLTQAGELFKDNVIDPVISGAKDAANQLASIATSEVGCYNMPMLQIASGGQNNRLTPEVVCTKVGQHCLAAMHLPHLRGAPDTLTSLSRTSGRGIILCFCC